ncbi:hypothetical protein GCM10010885_05150 [Alicyclobacillus cellulosilyticus]|uniref:SGNH hydrolase-type esterase domain-containing protein n=1 Tax=Alicyclobacillus cellulosilyticus TaxID=1003997 RepID=A0A917K2G5_9BACL|nr:SGNH/GDSL hydrolase family protein [Alicyclobacillus cellulosilyticus]GGI98615.1 hypothetical protein GCM10010885_05150 [Alicyclobacillus cellulosilyticus]
MHTYTALGDSITAGAGASAPGRAYPDLVTCGLPPAHTWRGFVLAEPGWTSGDLLATVIRFGPGPLAASTAITVWVGGDDLVQAGLRAAASPHPVRALPAWTARTIAQYAARLTALAAFIRQHSAARVVLCTQYNPFPRSPAASAAVAALNRATREVAARTGCVVAPVDAWFAGQEAELIAGYRRGRLEDVWCTGYAPVHPNDRGHRRIAAGLIPLLCG